MTASWLVSIIFVEKFDAEPETHRVAGAGT
jgi:hypothetical protein